MKSTALHRIKLGVLAVALALPFTTGAAGDGCASNSTSPAPDVTGLWDMTYDDSISVTATIGGVVYDETLGAQGGIFQINHEGQPLEFDLNCARPEVICPSEGWPAQVDIEQRNMMFEHRMIVTLPTQSCDGPLVAPDPAECGPGTENPDCDDICEGTVIVNETERFGVIGETGETFRLFLGGGIATNGINCALLAASVADATLVSTGTPEDGDWFATEMTAGLVTVGFAGGCLFTGQVDADPELEALLVGASLEFRTGFTGARAN